MPRLSPSPLRISPPSLPTDRQAPTDSAPRIDGRKAPKTSNAHRPPKTPNIKREPMRTSKRPNERQTRHTAKIYALNGNSGTERSSQTTHGTRECATMGEKRHSLTTTPAETKQATRREYAPQTERRRHPCKPHATHTATRDEPRKSTNAAPNAAQIPNAAHRWRGTRSRRACRACEKSRFPHPFFFSLGFIYILYFLCFFLSFLADIERKPRLCSYFLRNRQRITPTSGEGNERQTAKASRRACTILTFS